MELLPVSKRELKFFNTATQKWMTVVGQCELGQKILQAAKVFIIPKLIIYINFL
jgi:hypothetical protein